MVQTILIPLQSKERCNVSTQIIASVILSAVQPHAAENDRHAAVQALQKFSLHLLPAAGCNMIKLIM